MDGSKNTVLNASSEPAIVHHDTPSPETESEQTATPGKTNASEQTATPGKTNASEQTATPGKTNASEQTATPGKTNESEQTATPGKTNESEQTATPGKTNESEQSDKKHDIQTGSSSLTFKTPSFVIPIKKKVQSSNEALKMFKQPVKLSVSGGHNHDNEKIKTVTGERTEKDFKNEAEKTEIQSKALSPAEHLKLAKSAIPYKEPPWSTLCENKYSFEVIKNGAVIENVDLTSKTFYVVGRLPSCDVTMEHPSLSRHHAIIQYSSGSLETYPKGWYLYDLDSTHGTWINKNRVPPEKYHRLHVDFVLKFGGSTRLFILQGPSDDRLDESELSVKEMQEQREKQKKETDLLRQAELDEADRKAELLKKQEEDKGCAWGMEDDALEEGEENQENPFANIATNNEDLYIDDPKKSLNGYFEREGFDPPEYDFGEAGLGKWKCSVELPIDGPNGEPIMAEVLVSGKKREAVVACALEACRILDSHGELRKSNHESRKKKRRNWEEDDFYDSDEDVYLDRTGTIEKKREFRKMKVGKTDKAADTYDSLLEKHKNIVAEIEETEAKIEHAKAQAAALERDDVDALDAYMTAIKSGMMDTTSKMKLKRQLLELKQEEQKVRRLVNIAKPATLPELANTSGKQGPVKPSLIAAVGKMKGPSTQTKVNNKPAPVKKRKTIAEHQFEVEEDDDEERVDRKTDVTDIEKQSAVENTSNIKGIEVKQHEGSQKHVYSVTGKPTDFTSESKATSNKTNGQAQETKPAKDSTSRFKGPSMPLAAVLEKLQNEADAMEDEGTENVGGEQSNKPKDSLKRKSKGAGERSKKLKTADGDYNTSDPDYATWLPPQNQAGDGKTSLNERYGY